MPNIFYEGEEFTIEGAVCMNSSIPAREYLDSLDTSKRAKFLALFQRLGDHGKISNKEQFKRIEGTKLFEFKWFQDRLPCYFSSRRRIVTVTHGFTKKGNRIPKSQIERAERIKNEYEQMLKMEGLQ